MAGSAGRLARRRRATHGLVCYFQPAHSSRPSDALACKGCARRLSIGGCARRCPRAARANSAHLEAYPVGASLNAGAASLARDSGDARVRKGRRQGRRTSPSPFNRAARDRHRGRRDPLQLVHAAPQRRASEFWLANGMQVVVVPDTPRAGRHARGVVSRGRRRQRARPVGHRAFPRAPDVQVHQEAQVRASWRARCRAWAGATTR